MGGREIAVIFTSVSSLLPRKWAAGFPGAGLGSISALFFFGIGGLSPGQAQTGCIALGRRRIKIIVRPGEWVNAQLGLRSERVGKQGEKGVILGQASFFLQKTTKTLGTQLLFDKSDG